MGRSSIRGAPAYLEVTSSAGWALWPFFLEGKLFKRYTTASPQASLTDRTRNNLTKHKNGSSLGENKAGEQGQKNGTRSPCIMTATTSASFWGQNLMGKNKCCLSLPFPSMLFFCFFFVVVVQCCFILHVGTVASCQVISQDQTNLSGTQALTHSGRHAHTRAYSHLGYSQNNTVYHVGPHTQQLWSSPLFLCSASAVHRHLGHFCHSWGYFYYLLVLSPTHFFDLYKPVLKGKTLSQLQM